MTYTIWIAISVPILAIGTFVAGWVISKRISRAKVGSAEEEAKRIVEDSTREAESVLQNAKLEARSSELEQQEKLRREADQQRSELRRIAARQSDRDEKLDRRADELQSREQSITDRVGNLDDQERELQERRNELDTLADQQNTRLEEIAGMTAEDAKQHLIANMETKARSEGAHKAKEIRDTATREAQREAQEIIGMAIQRYAGEHTTETTVSVVNLPNEEMKGRIIGREGRNIRAFEMATGVDVIVDDTPEAVILSAFDPVRREVARLAMSKLVEDGRIHPGRIEELVTKAQEQVEEEAMKAGEEASYELGIHDMHPQLIKTLGKLKYRTSYGQNVLQHSKEVGIIAGLMSEEIGLDAALARRAGILHDIGKAVDRESEGTHVGLGLELVKKYGEPEDVQNALALHHEDVVEGSMYCVLVKASDTISSARPGARRETIEGYVKRLDRLESIAQAFDGVEKTFAIQAGREVRVMVNCSKIDDAHAELLAGEIAEKIQADMEYPGQIKVVVIRESRATSFAR
jgi:ribonucrease Y